MGLPGTVGNHLNQQGLNMTGKSGVNNVCLYYLLVFTRELSGHIIFWYEDRCEEIDVKFTSSLISNLSMKHSFYKQEQNPGRSQQFMP